MLPVLACRVLIAATFLAAAAAKLRNRSAFITDLSTMAVVPARYLRPVAAATVIAEAATGPVILAPPTARVGAALAMLLLATFIVVISSVLRRGTPVSCPCFGSSPTPLGVRHLVRNMILLVAAGVSLAGPAPTAPSVGAAIAAATGLVAASVIVRLDDLVALFSDPRPAHPDH